MILTVGNTKGGVGKSTLAINLATALAQHGQDVLLIDGDHEQQTATSFTELRVANHPGAPAYTAVALHGAAIRTQVRQLGSRYQHIIIDVGGHDSVSLRAAFVVSNLVIIPAAPRSFDLWGVDQTVKLVREARELNDNLRALAILNATDAVGSDNQDAVEALADFKDLEISACRLGRRKAFCNASAMGLGILEYADRSAVRAQEEFTALFDSLFPKLTSRPRPQKDHK
jgi:chromosome partitioning protein